MMTPKILSMAFDWYDGGVPPPASVAQEHFRKLAISRPAHAMELGEALLCFLKYRRWLEPTSTDAKAWVYNNADSHVVNGGEGFRQRMKAYAVQAPWGDGGGEE